MWKPQAVCNDRYEKPHRVRVRRREKFKVFFRRRVRRKNTSRPPVCPKDARSRPQSPLAAKSQDFAPASLLSPCRQILVPRPPIGALAALVRQEPYHLVLVQIHLAHVVVVVLIIAVKRAALAFVHIRRPLFLPLYGGGRAASSQNRNSSSWAGRMMDTS